MQKIKFQPQEIYQKIHEFGVKPSADMLVEIIENVKDQKLRKDAIKYLTLIIINADNLKEEFYEIFESLLISDDAIEIKSEAAKGLGKFQNIKALKPLKWVLEQESIDYNIRLSVLKAIRKTRFEDPEITIFIDELDSVYNSIREYVSIQLLSLEPEKLIEILLKSLLDKGYSNQHKIEFIKLIGYEISSINVSFEDVNYIKIKYPEILSNLKQNKTQLLESITQILKQEDENLLNSVVSILKLLGSDIEKDLFKLLLIDDFIVKKNAVVLCGRLKLNNSADYLISNLDNIYPEVSIAAIKALGEIGEISAVPELLDVLDIEDVSFEYLDIDFKFYILDAIKNIYQSNKHATFDHLYRNLSKENNTIRECVAFILGELGKEEFVEPLRNLLSIKNLDVRKNTIIALGKIGSFHCLEDLINIILDEKTYWLLKKVAIDAMYNIFQSNWYKVKENNQEIIRTANKSTAILTDFLRNAESENYKVKLSLIKLLESYGGEYVIDALLKRVNDFHRVVRIYASNAIKKIEESLDLDSNQ